MSASRSSQRVHSRGIVSSIGEIVKKKVLQSDLFSQDQLDDDVFLGLHMLHDKHAVLLDKAQLEGQIRSKYNSLMAQIPSGVDPFVVASKDMKSMAESIKDLVGSDHPVLSTVARYFFDAGGKRFRPNILILLARAMAGDVPRPGSTDVVTPSQKRLAEITEMIHTASLLHDDVLDDADTRRGVASVNAMFGSKLAVLGGDFLLARASILLARLRNFEAIELMSLSIEHLVKGEVLQMNGAKGESDAVFQQYLKKTYYKTSALIANSCRAVIVLEPHPAEYSQMAFEYGKNVGLAFQFVDDLLDFTGTSEILGKPALNDLREGLATAPVLFAAEEFPVLRAYMQRKFANPNDVEEARDMIQSSNALQRTKLLALQHTEKAIEVISPLPPSLAKDALIAMAGRVVTRLK
eukprot:GILK01005455.1.p1 GENE.GILK01005455.1~~GILK01005455.1.p1  ORF type:complete len:470 (-),score=75.63 GILK01005455.1:103-1326(-)